MSQYYSHSRDYDKLTNNWLPGLFIYRNYKEKRQNLTCEFCSIFLNDQPHPNSGLSGTNWTQTYRFFTFHS